MGSRRAATASLGLAVTPAGVFKVIVAVLGVLLAVSVAQDLVSYSGAQLHLERKIWFLDVDVERSVYTYASSMALFVASAILCTIGLDRHARGESISYQWLFLALVFLFLSADEALSFHEKVSSVLSSRLKTSGMFYFAWVIPAIGLLVVGFLAYIPFLRTLNPRVRVLMLTSAAIFLAGAVGMEMLSGRYVQLHGVETLVYRLMTNLEEGLEGFGTALFIFAIMKAGRGISISVAE
jgi:hypothetical protein